MGLVLSVVFLWRWTYATHPNTRGGSIKIEGIVECVESACSGVLNPNALESIRLIRWTTVVTVSVQNWLGAWAPMRRAQVVSRTCLFFLSATPFCWGVLGHEVSWIRPCCWKYSFIWLFTYSPPLSDLSTWILAEHWVCIITWNDFNIPNTSSLCLSR